MSLRYRRHQLLALCVLFSSPFVGCEPAVDGDGDGFTSDEDCDDTNPAIHPDSTEICDSRDNNCDGTIDEAGAFGSNFFYLDSDGDGYGSGDPVSACSPPSGHSNLDGDCDDGVAAVHPTAEELCNGEDEDCNELADFGGLPGSESDDDGDGVSECEGDCDDAVGHNFPGNEEVCDGDDNDCNDLADFPAGEGDEDGDLWSACLDCNDEDPAINPDAIEACDGIDTDCNGAADADPGGEQDVDQDGFLSCEECLDTNAAAYPGGIESCDGRDNDCSGAADFIRPNGPVGENDSDGDGSLACEDCNDSQGANFPGNTEICDGLDNDCDGASNFDQLGEIDADGDSSPSCIDCDDTDILNFPGNLEVCDGQDNDCNLLADADLVGVAGEVNLDGDPALSCDDCDDDPATGANNYPGNTEVCDGQDNDCLGGPDYIDAVLGGEEDTDGDGAPACNDCDDSNASIFFGNPELCDGEDNDCQGGADFPGGEIDIDLDGSFSCEDCDDGAPDNYPGNPEVCDGLDNDCNNLVDFGNPGVANQEVDGDGDGHYGCGDDCDDANAQANPGLSEACDGFDTDCDGIANFDAAGENDADGDGAVSCNDCDDIDANNYPGNTELCDGQDNDCDNHPTPFPALGTANLGGSVANEQDADGDNSIACEDCDDNPASGANNYPNNAEVCDGLDNDCDGVANFDAAGELDADNDQVRTCEGDCEDSPAAGGAAIYPGNIESCPDGIDNDCDGVIDWGYTQTSQALRLSPATSDYLSIPAFGPNSPTFTVEAWVKVDALSANSNTALSKTHQGGGVDVLLEATSAGDWQGTLNLNGEESILASSPVQTSAWTHLALSFNGTQMTIFVNGYAGTPIPSSNNLSFTPNNGQWLIGAEEDASGQAISFWDGLIDEVRIWEVDRNETDIQGAMCNPLTGTESNLLAYFPFDSDFNDASPNARHASVSGNAGLE